LNEIASQLIAKLDLVPLPHEGGFFRRTWTSATTRPDARAEGSAIYFLLTDEDFSAFHRLRTPELWLFHAGDEVEHVQLEPAAANPLVTMLGADPLVGHRPQLVVPGGVWQGAHLRRPQRHGWALCSCVMSPAWDDREFELGQPGRLLSEFPAAALWIPLLTR
jgi:predicted cupin superfamily sugar epimerase